MGAQRVCEVGEMPELAEMDTELEQNPPDAVSNVWPWRSLRLVCLYQSDGYLEKMSVIRHKYCSDARVLVALAERMAIKKPAQV